MYALAFYILGLYSSQAIADCCHASLGGVEPSPFGEQVLDGWKLGWVCDDGS